MTKNVKIVTNFVNIIGMLFVSLSLAVALAFMRAVAEVLSQISLTELLGFRCESIMAKIDMTERSDTFLVYGRCLNSQAASVSPEQNQINGAKRLPHCPSSL
jgi:hypothetical protein